ncbi:hypothetical protein JIP62_07120 [Brevundimonas vitis]|uniref:Uncharacterized protein n=1 Tax=Brevundimonas vitisensis TaxID=2800818 RepID=A0ABX7BQH7_9CAUL|nr:hypothetical protein [Brevundimonas vitisensis]QQQ19849.1 hypothetical protein JIP62_07120 [Brevundimonas vitisensis]
MLSDYDPESLSVQIEEIIDELDGAAAGVAQKLMADDDLKSLTPRQRTVYDALIVPSLIALAKRREARELQRRWDSAGE